MSLNSSFPARYVEKKKNKTDSSIDRLRLFDAFVVLQQKRIETICKVYSKRIKSCVDADQNGSNIKGSPSAIRGRPEMGTGGKHSSFVPSVIDDHLSRCIVFPVVHRKNTRDTEKVDKKKTSVYRWNYVQNFYFV